ncbi:MAG: hypothetical protein GXX84_16825 [Acidobacteria bacterium]|nr:hypothetical protein [Acidobacteriota bacterium]
MDSLADRLSRIAALRPVSTISRTATDVADACPDTLIQLLGGELRFTQFGSHVRVRRRFRSPQPEVISPRALRLICYNTSAVSPDLSGWLLLDTETTGLAGGTGTYAFLVGIAWWEQDSFVVEQLFMRNHGEEPSLLLDLESHFARDRVLVTFNGKSFDWPLLQTRFRISRIRIREPIAHIDLLHPARRLWRPQLGSVALTRLERQILKLDRGPDIPSESIPQIYFDFLRGAGPRAIAEVFHHNRMDLCGLGSLLVHLNTILSEPEECGCRGSELFGISRMLQKSGGEERLARRVYEKALESGLPADAERAARRELAFLAKRGCDFERANALWLELSNDSREGFRACEQLAIYYEHKARLPGKALAFSRQALAKLREAFHARRITLKEYQRRYAALQRRLTRLAAKL